MAVRTRDRMIFVVRAEVVDSNGAINPLSLDGTLYPQYFDSKAVTYSGDTDKCLDYAKAEFHKVCAHMLKRTDRQLQTCVLMTSDGRIIESFHKGAVAQEEYTVPDPEPEEPGEGGGE